MVHDPPQTRLCAVRSFLFARLTKLSHRSMHGRFVEGPGITRMTTRNPSTPTEVCLGGCDRDLSRKETSCQRATKVKINVQLSLGNSPVGINFDAMLPQEWIETFLVVSAYGIVMSLIEGRLLVALFITCIEPFPHLFCTVIAQSQLLQEISPSYLLSNRAIPFPHALHENACRKLWHSLLGMSRDLDNEHT